MYNIQLKTTKSTEQYIRDNPREFHEALVDGFRKAFLSVEERVKKSFGTGNKPKVRTGDLRRSIYSDVIDRGRHIAAIIGSDVSYAEVLEEGGRYITARPYIEPAIKGSQRHTEEIVSGEVKRRMESL